MSLVLLQYPVIILFFCITIILVLIAGFYHKHTFTFGILSGIATIFTMICGLFYAIPLEELLLLLLILVFFCILPLVKGGIA